MMNRGSHAASFGLIVVSAPSGAGKSSLCAELLKRMSDQLALSISTTSRDPRGSEKNGIEYFFVKREEFEAKISNSEFAEWANVHGSYYGTSKGTLQEFWSSGKHVLLDIDVQGTQTLREAFPSRTFTIFIEPPSLEELEKRLRGRGTETEEAIQKRMKNAVSEMRRKSEFDLVILNDEFHRAYGELELAVKGFTRSMEEGKWQKRP